MKNTGGWQPDFIEQTPQYDLFRTLALPFLSDSQWPDLDLLNKSAANNGFADYRFVEQSELTGNYEAFIHQHQRIPTRTENWHDFFHYLIWLLFPSAKTLINQRQVESMRQRPTVGRTPIENALTLFDENGIVLVSDEPDLFELVTDFAWLPLFWTERERLATHFECFVFGHSLHEKALQPYIGMTGHALLLPATSDFFRLDALDKQHWLDSAVTTRLQTLTAPSELQPFPVLGMPGWHPDTDFIDFYHNIRYFRPKKR